MNFPPFKSCAVCVKCGDLSIDARYSSTMEITKRSGTDDDPDIVHSAEEWQQRICRCCGFQWKEQCLDAPENPT